LQPDWFYMLDILLTCTCKPKRHITPHVKNMWCYQVIITEVLKNNPAVHKRTHRSVFNLSSNSYYDALRRRIYDLDGYVFMLMTP